MPAAQQVKKETQVEEGLGRSKGGFTSKIHMISDALGILYNRRRKSRLPASGWLLEPFKYDYALLDKAYDSHDIINHIVFTGAVVVIPARSNRKDPREHDQHIYKERHAIEFTFGWLTYFRRIFSRFDKLKQRFSDFAFAASIFRLRYLNNV